MPSIEYENVRHATLLSRAKSVNVRTETRRGKKGGQMKKLMMLMATVAIAFGAWADEKIIDGYTWTYHINGGTAEISRVSPSTGAVMIPSMLGGKPVTGIGYGAFSGCSGLTSVTIPDSVTSIGEYAFSGCSGLTSVTIPDSVTSIGSSAFSGCSGLTSVTIPNSVTSIGNFAFSGCNGLNSISVGSGNVNYKSVNGLLLSKDGKTLVQGLNGDVIIPDGVTSIGYGAFDGCIGLTSVTIPDSVTSIGARAFYGCSWLTSVTIPDSVTSIGWGVFDETPFYDNQPEGLMVFGKVVYGMKGTCLSSVIIPDGVTSIGDEAFFGCSGLKSVTIPNSVTSIGYEAFSGCSGLTSVTIPNSVNCIESYAFYGCSGLTSVTIPNSVTRIGDEAFDGCSNLLKVWVPKRFLERWMLFMEYSDEYNISSVFVAYDVVYNVQFDANGGMAGIGSLTWCNPQNPQPVVGTIPSAWRSGYIFDGWYTEKEGGERISGLTRVTGDVTYYAHWTASGAPQEPDVVVVTNTVENVVMVTNTITDHVTQTNIVKLVKTVTNIVEIVRGAAIVPEEVRIAEPGTVFTGLGKAKMNGIVFDAEGTMHGVIQIETAKASAKGVRVKGFVMLEDGKKVALKSATAPIKDGRLAVETTAGRLGMLQATVGGDGFKGTLGALKVVSADVGDDAGVLSGALTLKYLDASGRVKSQRITIGGVATSGTAAGTATQKGKPTKVFAAEFE